MDHQLRVICRGCRKLIEEPDLCSSVMVSLFIPRLNQYRGEGPFHAECGKMYNTQAPEMPRKGEQS